MSAWEREKRDKGKGKSKKDPLISVFSRINIEKGDLPKTAYYYPKKLSMNREIFPVTEINENLGYNKLWSSFIKEIEKMRKITEFSLYFNTLYFILQKYTWAIPSATYVDILDISLFEHLKTTCAIASCLTYVEDERIDLLIKALYKKWKIEETLRKEGLKGKELFYKTDEEFRKRANDNEKKIIKEKFFILIGGDISGIQDFIYSISSKGAAKSLKGRSFYLQILTEVIAKYVLKRLELPITNLLYVGEDHFFILAPKSLEDKFYDVKKKVGDILIEYHKGDLYLFLEKVEKIERSCKAYREWDLFNHEKAFELKEGLANHNKEFLGKLLHSKEDEYCGPNCQCREEI